MTYQVKFTETTNPAKPSITVEVQTLNTSTSLTFVGKNYAGYAPIIAENFLHLLENFARNTAPGELPNEGQPVQGQLWYDNSPGVNLLKVYDGTSWTAAGSVKKAAFAPLVANSLKGDLWVDTANQQLHIFSGSEWLLIGPQYSSGSKTGPIVETIADTNNVDNSVVSLYAQNNLIAVISKTAFSPKQTILGFPTIGQGITLSSIDALSASAPTKFHGTASQADALVVNGKTISSDNFLRSDVVTTANDALNVRSSRGVSVGSDLNFNIGTEDSGPVLLSRTSGKSIDIKVNNNNQILTAIHISATANVGIGPDNTNPAEALDVAGSVSVDNSIIVLGGVDSTVLGGPASITTNGGLNVDKKSNFGDTVTFYGQQIINSFDDNGDPKTGSVIVPGSTAANGKYDIGASDKKFRNIYAQSFVGEFSGNVTGSVVGDITGSAGSLAIAADLSITGDVQTLTSIRYNGTQQTVSFETKLTNAAITSQPAITTSQLTDQLLVFRDGTDGGLRSVTKASFISDIPSVPVGAVFPFAGVVLPPGYLLCDGSEVKVSTYSVLFSVIGYRFKNQVDLKGASTFGLPDFRGSFPLGKQDMDNKIEVPSKTDPNTLIPAITSKPLKVTDTSAKTLGAAGGKEIINIALENVPEHKHDLLSDAGQQYYVAGIPGALPDPEARAGYGMPNSSIGYGLPNSGGVDSTASNGKLGQPLSVMNPYLTMNYIIYTGVVA